MAKSLSTVSAAPSTTNTDAKGSSSWFNSSTIHIAVEVIVFGAAVFFFMKRTKAMQEEINLLKQQLMVQDQRTQELLKHVQQLYSMIEGKPPQAFPQPMPQPPKQQEAYQAPPQQPAAVAYQQQPPQQQQQRAARPPRSFMSTQPEQQRRPAQEQQQQPFRGMKNPLDTIMGIMPAIMPAMMGGPSEANIVITELKKPMPKPDVVEVMSEDEDPDIEEALNGGPLKAIEEEEEDLEN